MNIEHMIAHFVQAKEARKGVEYLWKGAYRVTDPSRAQMLGLNYEDASAITDSTAQVGVRLFAASLLGSITPSGSPWAMATGSVAMDYKQETTKWLQDISDIAMEELAASNFYSVMLEFYTDQVVAGTCGLFVTVVNGRLHFDIWRPETMYLSSSTGGAVDTVHRIIPMTIPQIVKKWDVLPPTLKDLSDDEGVDKTERYDILHCIMPNMDDGGLPFKSVYIYEPDVFMIHEGGYEEQPMIVPRWGIFPDTDYGVGILNEAVPAAMDLNEIKDMMKDNIGTAIEPPYVMAYDGVLNVNNITLGKGSVVMARDTNNIARLGNEADLPYVMQQVNELKTEIRTILMTDELLPSNRPNATATEIRTRTVTLRAILGGVFLKLETELLPLLTDRIFALLSREDKFPTITESVQKELADENGDILLNIVYSNASTRASASEDLDQQRVLEAGITNSAQFNPEVLDLYDFDQSVRTASKLLGTDATLIKAKDEVDQARKQRAEEQQQNEQLPPTDQVPK